MIKCQVTEDEKTGDKIMAFRIDTLELLTNQGVMNLLRDEIYQRVIAEVSQDYLKKNSATIIAKINIKELTNLVKNKISLEVIQNLKKESKPEKIEKPYCSKGCPDEIENLHCKQMKGNKRAKPVEPELCYERREFRCRLIDK